MSNTSKNHTHVICITKINRLLIPNRTSRLNNSSNASNNAAGSAAYNQSMIAESIKDFTLQLKFWGKSTLDEEAFHFLLDDIGYSRSRDGLFQSFLEEIELASPAYKHDSTISIKDLQYLYQSEPYRLPSQAAFNNGEALMSYVGALFRRADKTKDNELDLELEKDLITLIKQINLLKN